MKGYSKYIVLAAVSGVIFSGCQGGSTHNSTKQTMRETARERVAAHNVVNEFYSLPSPLEVASVVSGTGVEYEQRILHKTELGVRYSTNMAAAINLGIYGADLSYSIYFSQQHVALKYLDCIKELSSSLDISDILTQNKLKEMEENIQNKEMLKKIVTQTFFHSDALLKENSRRPTAVMIAFGMWIESLYISVELSNKNVEFNPPLTKCIVEQGLVFNDLMGMLSALDGSSNDIATIKSELEPLEEAYQKIADDLGGSFVPSSGKVDLQPELFKDFCSVVKSVRNDFTQLF